MYYIPDILCKRRKGKFAKIWLAATLNERLFKQSVSNRELLNIRVDIVCDEVLSIVGGGDKRFSLYLSSQLMYGLAKIHQYQANIYKGEMQIIFKEIHFDDTCTRMNKDDLPENWFCQIDLPDVPLVTETFKNLQMTKDVHLIPDADLDIIPINRRRVEAASPTFGKLSEKTVNVLLRTDDWRIESLAELSDMDVDQPMRILHRADENQLSDPAIIESQNDLVPFFDEYEQQDRERAPKTPKKSQPREPTVDTPTKRRRKLDISHDHQDAQSPSKTVPNLPENNIVTMMSEMDILQDHHQDAQSPSTPAPDVAKNNVATMISELLLDTPELPKKTKPLKKKRSKDEIIMINNAIFSKQITQLWANTIPKESALIVPERRRIVPAMNLLQIPSTNYQTTQYDWVPKGCSRYRKWASELIPIFESRTYGPFTAEDDRSIEIVKIGEDQSNLLEIGSRMKGFDLTSYNKNIEETTNPEEINTSEVINIERQEVQDELISENTGNAVGDLQNTSTGAADTLPAKSTTNPSPTSSLDKNSYYAWPKADLFQYLNALWDEYEGTTKTVTVSYIVPPERTSKLEAVMCFTALLEMNQEGLIRLVQAEPFAEIYIYKSVAN